MGRGWSPCADQRLLIFVIGEESPICQETVSSGIFVGFFTSLKRSLLSTAIACPEK